jgi:hypothetical protein
VALVVSVRTLARGNAEREIRRARAHGAHQQEDDGHDDENRRERPLHDAEEDQEGDDDGYDDADGAVDRAHVLLHGILLNQ